MSTANAKVNHRALWAVGIVAFVLGGVVYLAHVETGWLRLTLRLLVGAVGVAVYAVVSRRQQL